MLPADLTNLAGQTDEQLGRSHVSYSQLGTFMACAQRHHLAYEQRLELIERPKALGMGSAFHKALELGDPIAGANELDRATTSQEEYDQLLIDKATVACAAEAYFEKWGGRKVTDFGGIPIIADPRVPTDEIWTRQEYKYRVRVRNPLGGTYHPSYDLLGYADAVTDHGTHLSMDETKFVGQINAQSVRRVALDRQVSLTSYALWRITGKEVRQVNYRFIRKPTIKQRQKETVDEYVQRLQTDYAERPDFYLAEEQTLRSAGDMYLTECELWELVLDVEREQRRDVHVRDTARCGDYGGCQFLALCGGDPDAMSLYRRKTER